MNAIGYAILVFVTSHIVMASILQFGETPKRQREILKRNTLSILINSALLALATLLIMWGK